MNKAVLLGTSHPVQKGNNQKCNFMSHIEQLCSTYHVRAIAEEIDNNTSSIAADVSSNLGIAYKIIEPTPIELQELGIEEIHCIEYELMSRYELKIWPDNPNVENLVSDVYKEYHERLQATYRQRESEWLKRINEINTWPVLIICGADHYDPFCELLISSDIDVEKAEKKWVG